MNNGIRRNFNPGYVKREFERIDKALTGKTVMYVIGGAVMALRGLKTGTKDIDVVVETKKSAVELIEGLKNCGYYQLLAADLSKAYNDLSAVILENEDGFRWDIFIKVVAHKLFISDHMKKRTTLMYSGIKLTAMEVSNEDIFLLKGVTERDSDIDDMYQLARSGIDYDTVYSECLFQSRNSERIWEIALYGQCNDLEKTYGVVVPFMKKLRSEGETKMLQLLMRQILEKGPITEEKLLTYNTELKKADIKSGLKMLKKRKEIVRYPDGTIALVKKLNTNS
jgi:hypothetical protein